MGVFPSLKIHMQKLTCYGSEQDVHAELSIA